MPNRWVPGWAPRCAQLTGIRWDRSSVVRPSANDAYARAVDGVVGVETANRLIAEFVEAFPGAPRIVSVPRFGALLADVRADAERQQAGEYSVKGAFNHRDGSVYVVVGNHRTIADLEATLFHEVLGHVGIRRMFGRDFVRKLNQVFVGLGGIGGLSDVMYRRGQHPRLMEYIEGIREAQRSDPARMPEALARAILTEEVFAHIAEQRGQKGLRDRFMELLGAIRQWLRDTGWFKLARLGESDLVYMLSRAREEIQSGDTSVMRDPQPVGSEVVDADGRPMPPDDPDYDAALRLADVLGLREQPAATVFRVSDNAAPAGDGLTADQLRAALVDRFGEDGVASLEAQGLLNIAEGTDSTNPAWYDPETGRAYFVPEFIGSEKDAVAAVLHEVGEHHGLAGMLGPRAWRTLKGRVAQMARAKGDVRAAWDGVIDNYDEFADLAGADPSSAIDNDRFMHEVIAKIGETAAGRKTGLWRDILAAVNRFLLKMGLGRQINKNELADLVEGSLKRVMRGSGPDGGPRGGRRMNSQQSSERETTARRLGKFFAEYSAGRVPAEFNQVLGETPRVLAAVMEKFGIAAGAQDYPLEISAASIGHILNDSHMQEITLDTIAEAIDGMYDPVMVFRSDTVAGSLVVLTESHDRRGNPVVVALHLSRMAGRLRVNRIASVTGRMMPRGTWSGGRRPG